MAIMIRISLILSTSPSHPYRRLDCQLKWSYGHYPHVSLCTWIWDLHSHNSTHWSNLTHWWLMLWCWFIGLFMMGTPPCSCRRIPDNQSYNPTLFLHTRCYFSVSKLAQKPTSPGLHLGMQSLPSSTRYFRNCSETSLFDWKHRNQSLGFGWLEWLEVYFTPLWCWRGEFYQNAHHMRG